MESGFDTVKVIAPVKRSGSWFLHRHLVPNRMYGSKGPVWYRGYDVPDLETSVVVKGVGSQAYIMWEGSVPKSLGLPGVATASDVLAWEQTLVESIPELEGYYRTRVDVTEDLADEHGLLRGVAATGWMPPHERARYVRAIYQECETIFFHNKTRGVRVYDKNAECGHPWSVGITRVEYQIRGEWVKALRLRDAKESLGVSGRCAIEPVVTSLVDRASEVGYRVA